MRARRGFVRMSAGAVAAVAVLLSVGPASAEGAPTELVFTREEPGHPARTATLSCDPAGGSHPNAEAACGYLASIDELTLPVQNPAVRCFRYHPVKYRAEGTLRGAPVSVENTYGCLVPEMPVAWQF